MPLLKMNTLTVVNLIYFIKINLKKFNHYHNQDKRLIEIQFQLALFQSHKIIILKSKEMTNSMKLVKYRSFMKKALTKINLNE